MTTGMPSWFAAVSLPAVSGPPLFLVTSTSIRCWVMIARSAPASPGSRVTMTCRAAGSGSAGGLAQRIRNHVWSSAAKAASPCRPVVRNARRPADGSDSAAACSELTSRQSSPGAAVHGGRRSRSSGSRDRAQARAACALMICANGWVASITAATCSARSQSASPSAPLKPPIRTSPAGRAGSAVRPASEEITRRSGRVASREASSRASAVPPRIRTVVLTCGPAA
jgi:hypothetical protein